MTGATIDDAAVAEMARPLRAAVRDLGHGAGRGAGGGGVKDMGEAMGAIRLTTAQATMRGL